MNIPQARPGSADRRHRGKPIAMLSVAVLVLVALMGYLIWSGNRDAILAAETTTRNYAAIIEARLDATLRRADADLQDLARTIPAAALSKQAVPRYARELDARLDSRLTNFPELNGLRVFDADGDMIYTTDSKTVPSVNIADREYFRQLRDNPQAGPVFTEVVVSRATSRHVVAIAKAIWDAQGVFRGVMIASVELEYFQKLFQSLDIGARGIIAIHRNNDFSLVARWPLGGGKINTRLPPDNPARTALASGNKQATVEFSSSVDGIMRVYSFHVLERYPFFVTAALAHEDVLAGWKARALAVGLSGLLLVALLAGLLYRLWRIEAELKANEELMRSTFEHAAVGIAHIAPHTYRILGANNRFCNLLGYTRDDLTGTDSRLLTPSGDLPAREDERAQVMAGTLKTTSSERQLLRKDGSLLWVNRSLSLVRDPAGLPQYFISVIEDVSARKQAEQALRESEQRFRILFEQAAVGVAEVESATDQFIRVNQKYADIAGYTIAEMLHRKTHSITHPEDLPENQAYTERLRAGRIAAFSLDKRYRRKDGSIVWVNVTVSPMRKADGTFDYHSTVAQDITARVNAEAKRKVLETQLRQSQKMEAIGTLAGGIAHDFNNILAAIIGNAELARRDVGNRHPALTSLDEIRKASVRAKELVQRILTFSRQQPQSRQPLMLTPVVEEALKLLRATLPAGVEIALTSADDTPNALADPTQVHEVMLNLGTNAWHALEDKPGRIDIRLEAMSMDAETAVAGLGSGRYAHLTVRDTGCGMDAATIERIFEPFFTTKSVEAGTGLGLSVVHGIMQAHEGAIRIDSAPGRGTTVHLYFPAIDVPVEASAPAQESTALPRGRGQHVLYLDDEEALVLLVTRLLEHDGYTVSGYTDAEAALAAVRADPGQFDLVVTDYNMPGMSGTDVAEELARIRPDLPVAITSGYITDGLRQQAERAGVQHLIYKPNTVEELCKAVRELTQAKQSA